MNIEPMFLEAERNYQMFLGCRRAVTAISLVLKCSGTSISQHLKSLMFSLLSGCNLSSFLC